MVEVATRRTLTTFSTGSKLALLQPLVPKVKELPSPFLAETGIHSSLPSTCTSMVPAVILPLLPLLRGR